MNIKHSRAIITAALSLCLFVSTTVTGQQSTVTFKPPDDIEFAMLDMVADVMKDNSRLGCQIKMKPELDGIEVTVAPASGF